MNRQIKLIGLGVIAAVILITYHPALNIGFVMDDYDFVERAGRFESFAQYLGEYFANPIAGHYFRLAQNLQILIEYWLFGSNAPIYHALQNLLHLANGILLFTLVTRITNTWRVGFLSALVFATMPIYNKSVHWISVPDPLAFLFYLLTILFWLSYLQTKARRDFIFAGLTFALALLTKEMSVTLLAMLMLADWLLMQSNWRTRKFWIRYIFLGVIWLAYLYIQFTFFQTDSPMTRDARVYVSIVDDLARELPAYLTLIVAPWGVPAPWSYLWLAITLGLFGWFVWHTRSRALVFLGIATPLIALPLMIFACACERYLYMPMAASGIFIGAGLEQIIRQARWRWVKIILSGGIALVLVGNGSANSEAAEYFAGFGRDHRAALRVVSQAYPNLTAGTSVYLVAPPMPDAFLTGMFFLRYGPTVKLINTQTIIAAAWRDQPNALVLYWAEGKPQVQAVRPLLNARTHPPIPTNWNVPLRLEKYELANTTIRHNDALVLLLYWRATGKVDRDYTLFVHLLDETGQMIAGYDGLPQNGKEHTGAWRVDQVVEDAHIIPITAEIPAGKNYSLAIGWYYLPTMERLVIVGDDHAPITDHVMLGAFEIVE